MLSSPITEGEVIGAKYRVDRLLGIGGMGLVVAAYHLQLERRVALKFLRPEIAERGAAAERFRREAKAAARITNEHVSRVLDVDTTDDGVPFIVMEYLEGRTLGAELERRGSLPLAEAADLLLQAGEAIAEAHALGIVHRDLKPDNLFLTRRASGEPMLKVLDFGISKSLVLDGEGVSITDASEMVGSPQYMSPEQLLSARGVDPRTDIWSFGVILYEMLGGQRPFDGEVIPQLCSAILEQQPIPLGHLRPDLPDEILALSQSCLEKDRELRPVSMAEVCARLSPFGTSRLALRGSRAWFEGKDTLPSFGPFPDEGEATGDITRPVIVGRDWARPARPALGTTGVSLARSSLERIPSRGSRLGIAAVALLTLLASMAVGRWFPVPGGPKVVPPAPENISIPTPANPAAVGLTATSEPAAPVPSAAEPVASDPGSGPARAGERSPAEPGDPAGRDPDGAEKPATVQAKPASTPPASTRKNRTPIAPGDPGSRGKGPRPAPAPGAEIEDFGGRK